MSFLVKESPRWLENHGRHEEALASVAAYRGVDVNDTEARQAYQEIADAVAYEKSVMVKGFKALFANDELQSRRRLLIACSVQFFQQLGGINAIIYYSGYALTNSLRLSPAQASLWSGGLFTCFFGTLLLRVHTSTVSARSNVVSDVPACSRLIRPMGLD